MRILIWHGWLLEGSGSNVATARVAEAWRAAGHDVLLICQERHPERYTWIDAHGLVDADGPRDVSTRRDPDGGRCTLLRPLIGATLPVFVVDRYEGFDDVRRFLDLTDEELDAYLQVNVEALQAAVRWHESDVVFTGHAIPGAVIGRRAAGVGNYVAKIHGSDLEYAVRVQDRYLELAREGLSGARAVVGPGAEVLERCTSLVPQVRKLGRIVPPGVDVGTFRRRPRAEALLAAADRLARDPQTARGRPEGTDEQVGRALAARDVASLDAIAMKYDQEAPDPEAAARLSGLARSITPVVGYLGKLIPQKGPELVLAGQQMFSRDTEALIVGFGSYREWLAALAIAYRSEDHTAVEWLRDAGSMAVGHGQAVAGVRRGVTFTGRLDHRYACDALAAMDVLVVPSILPEAFGMVAAEGAAAGALPLVARHSGLAEVAAALESEVGAPGRFSFEPGEGAAGRLAVALETLLSLPAQERDEQSQAVSAFVGREWTWQRTATKLLAEA